MESNFREMRRMKQKLTDAECREILKREIRGTLAVNGDDGYPYAFPMNYCFDEKSGNIYFHCAKEGYKIDALKRSCKVCFCLHDGGYSKDGNLPRDFKSVVIFGEIRFIDDSDTTRYLRMFDSKYESDDDVEIHIKRGEHRVQMLEMVVAHMTGKSVVEG